MATFRITVQKQITDGYWPVYIRVIHHRGSVFMKTDKMVDNKGIVKSTKEVKDPFVRKSLDILIADYIDRLNKVDISTWSVNHENCTDTVRIRAKDLEFYSKFMPELQQLLLVL